MLIVAVFLSFLLKTNMKQCAGSESNSKLGSHHLREPLLVHSPTNNHLTPTAYLSIALTRTTVHPASKGPIGDAIRSIWTRPLRNVSSPNLVLAICI